MRKKKVNKSGKNSMQLKNEHNFDLPSNLIQNQSSTVQDNNSAFVSIGHKEFNQYIKSVDDGVKFFRIKKRCNTSKARS